MKVYLLEKIHKVKKYENIKNTLSLEFTWQFSYAFLLSST